MVQTKLSGVTTLQQPTHLSPPRTPVGRAGGKRAAAHRLLERQRLQRPSHGEKCAFPENRCWRVCTLQDWENTNKSKHIYIYTSLSLSLFFSLIYLSTFLSLSLSFSAFHLSLTAYGAGMIFMRRLETENTKKPNGFQAKRIETVTLALRDGGTPNVQQKQCGFILRVKVRLYYIFFPIDMYVYIYIYGT